MNPFYFDFLEMVMMSFSSTTILHMLNLSICHLKHILKVETSICMTKKTNSGKFNVIFENI